MEKQKAERQAKLIKMQEEEAKAQAIKEQAKAAKAELAKKVAAEAAAKQTPKATEKPPIKLFRGKKTEKKIESDSEGDEGQKSDGGGKKADSGPKRIGGLRGSMNADMTQFATGKQVDEMRSKFLQDMDELSQSFKKLSLQISTSGEKQNIEAEQIKKTVYSMESEVTTKLYQMAIEMEGFIKARKRDKNDQNALIRSLQEKVKQQEKDSAYNKKSVENVATSVCITLFSIFTYRSS